MSRTSWLSGERLSKNNTRRGAGGIINLPRRRMATITFPFSLLNFVDQNVSSRKNLLSLDLNVNKKKFGEKHVH